MQSARSYQVSILLFLCFVAATNALPEKDATPPTGNKEPLPQAPAEVGWQSIFWGLFALAVHAMSVPSLGDLGLLQNTESLLYPLRSSPLICVIDALDILVTFFVLVVLNRESVKHAACTIQLRRHLERGGSVIDFPEENTPMKHPITSLVWLLGTATQAVKIFSFQGEGTRWAKAAAGMYLGSYIVLVVARLLPRTSTSTHQKWTYEYVLPGAYLCLVAIGLNTAFVCYAMFQVVHIEHVVGKGVAEDGFEPFVCYMLFPLVLVVLFLMMSVLVLWFIKSKLALCAIGVPMLFGLLFSFIYNTGTINWLLGIANGAMQGGFLLALGIMGLFGMNVACVWVSKRVEFLSEMESLSGAEFSAYAFATMNLVVACLYCRFAYDSKGTVKPSWTENLG